MNMNGNYQLIGLTPRTLRRPLELALGMGIPLAGFLLVAESSAQLRILWTLLPAMLLAGWHVLRINDLLFLRPEPTVDQLFQLRNLVPIGVCPLLATALLSRNEAAALVLVLVMLNWDSYARWGKRHWAGGLVHNALGGGLHFLLGATAAGGVDTLSALAFPTLFFALTMAGAGCHHDALHEAEDRVHGYRTGAVAWGARRWWLLGIAPMAAAQVALAFSPPPLAVPFAVAFLAYLALYLGFARRLAPHADPAFRALCRIAYALAGIAFVVIRLKAILAS
jgi:hypothetical protein